MHVEDSFYWSKYGFGKPRLQETPNANCDLIVTIPCFDESNLLDSLLSLTQNEYPDTDVEVIVVVNAPENSSDAILENNRVALSQTVQIQNHLPSWLKVYAIDEQSLPKKHGGVGLARKIAMDEAAWRYESCGNEQGVIVCFDADSLCETNYLKSIAQHFKHFPRTPGCSIRYEHPISGSEHSPNVYDAIVLYEMHLRYYVMKQKELDLPYAYQTVGSSMAVRWRDYQKEGGMNKRKAGEDFYFLHKIIARGNFTNLDATKVIPSPRMSERVPFGTGRAVKEMLDENRTHYLTYNPKSFDDLRLFLTQVETSGADLNVSKLPDSIREFLQSQDWDSVCAEINANTSDPIQFAKRFYRWFNAFKLMKFLHFARDNFFEDTDVVEAAKQFLSHSHELSKDASPREVLELLRKAELQSNTR